MTTKRKIAVVELLIFIGVLAWIFWPRSFEKAMELGVEIGEYTHYAGSLHMYARDYEAALKNMSEGKCSCKHN